MGTALCKLNVSPCQTKPHNTIMPDWATHLKTLVLPFWFLCVVHLVLWALFKHSNTNFYKPKPIQRGPCLQTWLIWERPKHTLEIPSCSLDGSPIRAWEKSPHTYITLIGREVKKPVMLMRICSIGVSSHLPLLYPQLVVWPTAPRKPCVFPSQSRSSLVWMTEIYGGHCRDLPGFGVWS